MIFYLSLGAICSRLFILYSSSVLSDTYPIPPHWWPSWGILQIYREKNLLGGQKIGGYQSKATLAGDRNRNWGILFPNRRHRDDHDNKEVVPGIRIFVLRHIQNLDKVLVDIERSGATLSGEKSQFCMFGIKIVGFVCDGAGRHPDSVKVIKIIEWEDCRDVTAARAFMGICTYYNLSNITLIFTIALFSNFWQSASILNQLIMDTIGLFSLNSRHVMASADSSTASLSSETNVPNSSMIEAATEIAPIADIAISYTNETRRGFKYIVSMSLSGINGASYFQDQNVSDFLNRFDFMCENYELFEVDRIKRFLWYCEKTIDEYLRMLTKFNDEFWQEVKKVLRKEYEEQDVDQQMNTREFLEALIRKPRTEGDLKERVLFR